MRADCYSVKMRGLSLRYRVVLPDGPIRHRALLAAAPGYTTDSWKPVLSELTDAGCLCVLVDLPGFGDSPVDPDLDPSIDGLADHVAELAAEWGLERPHVVGNSMGGAIALELGRRGVAGAVTESADSFSL